MIPFSHYQESVEYLQRVTSGFAPRVALVLGSGLGVLGDRVEDPIFVDYKDIPHFPVSTAPGHKGRLVFGRLGGQRVAVMQGRIHGYEGRAAEELVYPLRVLKLMGADTLFVTNACGAVNLAFAPGQLMLIEDHIMLFPMSPLTGENLAELGCRFPDMSKAYTPALRAVARKQAEALGIRLQQGVYMYFPGPQYETPAEIRAARALGADAVGMSTVPEVIAAAHMGMQVLGVSLLSNMAAGVLDQPLTEEEVLQMGEACREDFSRLILGCLSGLDHQPA